MPVRPEGLVESFIRLSAQVKGADDRKKLAEMCRGRLRNAFDAISEEAFLLNYANPPITIKSLKVIPTAEDDNLARVVYQVEIENTGGTDVTTETNEREVELLRVDGKWYLEAIRPKGSDQIAFTRGMMF
jgi:hypothetical protein